MRVALVCGLAALAASAVLLADRLEDTFYVPLDDPAIQYAGPSTDPIARLEKQLESGQAKLDYAPNGWGYLPAILKKLDINIDSQVLVFSRTSIQTSASLPARRARFISTTMWRSGLCRTARCWSCRGSIQGKASIFYSLDTAKSR